MLCQLHDNAIIKSMFCYDKIMEKSKCRKQNGEVMNKYNLNTAQDNSCYYKVFVKLEQYR